MAKKARKGHIKRGMSQIVQLACPRINTDIEHFGDYQNAIFKTIVGDGRNYWFRGHANISWGLVPSALRYKTASDRDKAIGLLSDFKRYGDRKISPKLSQDDNFNWLQLAQHYGLPTSLLDWTQNMSIALFFACQEAKDIDGNLYDGSVFIMEPIRLNRKSIKQSRILDANNDSDIIANYVALSGKQEGHGLKIIAVNPVWNSERIDIQKGAFTLHGSCGFALDEKQAPGLMHLRIRKEVKRQILIELERNGIHEMAIFPELEHTCKYLKWANNL